MLRASSISHQSNYSPAGHCIFCGKLDLQLNHTLRGEHIMPRFLNGTLVLPEASCDPCRGVTRAFERIVARFMYGRLRLRLGYRTEGRRGPTEFDVLSSTDDSGQFAKTRVPILHYPTHYVSALLPPPGILTGAPATDTNPEFTLEIKATTQQVADLMKQQGLQQLQLTDEWHWGAFCRTLAKIGHTFTVANLGTEGYEPFLIKLIDGSCAHYAYYIGGLSEDIEQCTNPYDLVLDTVEHGDEQYLVARISLLGFGRLPTYQVLSGRVLDRNLISSKISSMQN